MSIKVNGSVTWVGKTDWELRTFHGEEYTTRRGSSYNSFLIKDEKNVLVDTVWSPYAKEFVESLKDEIDLKQIDFIIASHAEPDHSGALPELLKYIPDVPLYCSANGVKSFKGHYHQDWNFKVVKTGDKISIGNKELIFIEAPMLHWPDSLFTYLTGDNILFSNDAFGQHYASEEMFNDLVDQCELFEESIKYYANILTPFNRQVEKKIKELLALNLPVDMICTSHGVIWRDNPLQIVNRYLEWSNNYQEHQITILYDTMWNATRKMAEAIAEGIKTVDESIKVKLFNTARTDNTSIMAEVFKSKGILVGSATINRGMLSSIAATLEEIRGLGFKNKKAAAFGSYGWSGEAVGMINEELKKAGFGVINEGLKDFWFPDQEGIEKGIQFGKEFVEKVNIG